MMDFDVSIGMNLVFSTDLSTLSSTINRSTRDPLHVKSSHIIGLTSKSQFVEGQFFYEGLRRHVVFC